MYIYQDPSWPIFRWDSAAIAPLLADVKFRQGFLLGRVRDWGFDPSQTISADVLVTDIISNSKIEGEDLPADQVRSSVARKLGLPDAGTGERDRYVEGVVEMMLDASQNYERRITEQRLFSWHAALFPTGYSGRARITVGGYRSHGDDDPMRVVSGSFGRPRVHFEAPPSSSVKPMMQRLMAFIQQDDSMDSLIKAALVHLWLVTIHPFDDGNGRITRAVTESLLCRADGSSQRFYSMSAAILSSRKQYYRQLESSQKGTVEVTAWLTWFLQTLGEAIEKADGSFDQIFAKSRFWKRHEAHSINPRQRMIINKLWDGYQGKLTSSRYAKFTGVSQDTASRDIKDLMAKGLLKIGPEAGRSTRYLLITDT